MIKLIIPHHVHQKVMHWVLKADKEVSGFGTIVRDGDTLRVHDAYLLKQEVGSAHTDIEAEAVNRLLYTSRNDPGELRWWWHSHVRMSVFWSDTDKKTILELGGQGWIAATVFNQMQETRSAVAWVTDGEFGKATTMRDEVNTVIEMNITQEELDKWDKEFVECVKEKQFIASTWEEHYDTAYGQGSLIKRWSADPDPSPLEYKYGYEEGLLGEGITISDEAKALDMFLYQYIALLNGKDAGEIATTMDELSELYEQGAFDEVLANLAYKKAYPPVKNKKTNRKEVKDVRA
jgi:hypothetical protein